MVFTALPPPAVQEVLDDLRRIVRVLRHSSRAAQQRLGVTGAQLFVLKALAESPRLSMNDLAVRTRTHQSTVSVVAKRLVARGLVRRTVAEHDARSVELSLTARGRWLLSKAPHAAQEALTLGLERLPGRKQVALAAALRELVTAMGLTDEDPGMFFEDDEPRSRRGKERRDGRV